MADRAEVLSGLLVTALESIDDAPADKRAPLMGQVRAILAELDELELKAAKGGDPIDELASRRAARGAGSGEGSRRSRRSER